MSGYQPRKLQVTDERIVRRIAGGAKVHTMKAGQFSTPHMKAFEKKQKELEYQHQMPSKNNYGSDVDIEEQGRTLANGETFRRKCVFKKTRGSMLRK